MTTAAAIVAGMPMAMTWITNPSTVRSHPFRPSATSVAVPQPMIAASNAVPHPRRLPSSRNASRVMARATTTATYGSVMETGRVVMDGAGEKLLADEEVREFYLGLHGGEGEKHSFRGARRYKRLRRWF